MAFETAIEKASAVVRASNTLSQLRTAHALAQRLQSAVDLYQAGTDPTFNAAFNALFTTAELQELAAMIGQLTALCITDWEVNHPAALGLP